MKNIYIYIKEIIKKRTKRIFHNSLVLTFSLLLQIFRYNVYKYLAKFQSPTAVNKLAKNYSTGMNFKDDL